MLNPGLRYDYQARPYERNKGLSDFFPDAVDWANGLRGAVVCEGQGFQGGTFNPGYTNFGPALAWPNDAGGHGTTVTRGGYSIYCPDIFNMQYFGNTNGFLDVTLIPKSFTSALQLSCPAFIRALH